MDDQIDLEILPDGTATRTTGTIRATQHKSADALLEGIAALLGGEVTAEKNQHAHALADDHDHDHEHARK